jgi:D-amino-acid dehydrogenase
MAVLGAGVIGVTAAWYLRRDGHDVVVVDRQAAAAQETSFANGGQISVSHAEPWANPHAPLKALQWLGREDAPLLFRLRADPALWAWGLRFLAECRSDRTRHNIRQILALALYSRGELQRLRDELGLQYNQKQRGILHFYTDAKDFAAAREAAELMRRYGCDRRILSADEAVAVEPALADARALLVGADYTAADESGDAMQFTQRLAARAEEAGVKFQWDAAIEALLPVQGDASRLGMVRLGGGQNIEADAFVLALGSHTPRLLRPLGRDIPVYPAKGYSVTYQLAPESVAPEVSLTDDGQKIVISRLGDRLRVAGTAEFSGYSDTINDRRCRMIETRIAELFPRLGAVGAPSRWTGLRPSTPSNRPLIGRFGWDNCYLDTGHGTLGWTMACGSGRALADLVAGRRPEPAFDFLGDTP